MLAVFQAIPEQKKNVISRKRTKVELEMCVVWLIYDDAARHQQFRDLYIIGNFYALSLPNDNIHTINND